MVGPAVVLGFLMRPRVLLGIGVAAAVAYGAWHFYDAGRDAALEDVEEQAEDAREDANEAAVDRRTCVDNGGVWDFAASKCRNAP